MARRHPSLIPLSREHHDGLILAIRLQQREKALLRLWSHDPEFQSRYIVDFYESDLRPHFEAEERVLFPIIARHVPDAVPIVDRLTAEHRLLEHLVGEFRRPNMETLDARLREFGETLEHHIRTEDRTLFPMFEDHAPPEVLKEAELAIQRFYEERRPPSE